MEKYGKGKWLATLNDNEHIFVDRTTMDIKVRCCYFKPVTCLS